MSAFQNHGALISIGGAILYTIGLNPQRISSAREGRFPAHAIPAGLAYQRTGVGEHSVAIEATTFPHVTGGLDAFARLEAILNTQAVVPLVRLQGNYLGQASGLCVIQSLEADEERLHPFDGIGRQIDVTIGLIMLPSSAGAFARDNIGSFGVFR